MAVGFRSIVSVKGRPGLWEVVQVVGKGKAMPAQNLGGIQLEAVAANPRLVTLRPLRPGLLRSGEDKFVTVPASRVKKAKSKGTSLGKSRRKM